MNKQSGESGFTLLEMLAVITIFAIGAAIAVGHMRDIMRRSSLKSDADLVFNTIASVRMQAMKENRQLLICFDPGNQQFNIYNDRGAGGWDCGAIDDRLQASYSLIEGNIFDAGDAAFNAIGAGAIDPDAVGYGGNRILFTTQGLPSPAWHGAEHFVYITNEASDRTYAVGTLLTGALRLRRWESTSNSWSDTQ